ncbi:HNH endonuclease [Luteimicrobium subarcticum]|uniref:HNH endonuclease n=1 Tax=Luteimicrobium subarcticum TaxID=620910 RepID=A0A2M8W6N6_9MICO|nr:HNH endonuclease [Luteimicrobium subarcticum]PJI86569.1 HNH endonuclease [Luteimicrobium subarcticum]
MVEKKVDAVWVWEYGVTAQKAIYGRFTDDPHDRSYTKDYLQASQGHGQLFKKVFPALGAGRFDVTYGWPGGSMEGFLSYSADRHHLAWPTTTRRGPEPWRMSPNPDPHGPETFTGDPTATNTSDANVALEDFRRSGERGVIVAVKLAGESDQLHLRAYLRQPASPRAYASTENLPQAIRILTFGFNRRKACQSRDFTLPGAPALYFNTTENHAAWSLTPSNSLSSDTLGSDAASSATGPADHASTSAHRRIATPTLDGEDLPGVSTPSPGDASGLVASTGSLADERSRNDDVIAEAADYDESEVSALERQISDTYFSVPDATATVKTRGSAQRAFAKLVKSNYGYRCAVTGIMTREFLVASHIVPWADDESIRLDPENGICLSTLVDRAFDTGFLTIDTDLIIHISTERLANDLSLLGSLRQYDGVRLRLPTRDAPNREFLQRRLGKWVD